MLLLSEESIVSFSKILLINCSYVKSQIRNLQTQERLESRGVEFAWPEDCTAAMLRIACDRSINGWYLFSCLAAAG
jgi:hypothetical protein